MAGDRELSKLKKDLQKNRDEIAALQKRIAALIDKRRAQDEKKSSHSPKPPRD